jgi:hypothetical protein
MLVKNLLPMVLVGMLAATGTAIAERWVQYPGDEYSWIDLDSINTDAQGYIHTREHMGKNPRGPIDAMMNYHEEMAYDCKSRKYYSFLSKKWFDITNDWQFNQVCGARR